MALLLETILPSPFMYIYIAIITLILQVMMCHIDSAHASQYINYKLESWLTGHLEKGSVHQNGEARYVNVQGSVHWEGVCIVGGATFFN